MTELFELIRQGSAQAWLFIPMAIALGALHGLEPGHSKTMMAAFIVAIRGTVKQAVLLGLSATISHTMVVWLVALAGLYFGEKWASEAMEPYFHIGSGVLIILVAAWMMLRTWRHLHAHAHGHDHDHHHHHHPIPQGQVTTGQIMMFGFTGGLIPCPAAITVLLLCLQVKQLSLGVALVLAFSVGLALTLVGAGVVAALGARHASSKWPLLEKIAVRAPYISGSIIILLGVYTLIHGLYAL